MEESTQNISPFNSSIAEPQSSKIEVMHDYFSNIKTVLEDDSSKGPSNQSNQSTNQSQSTLYPPNIQAHLDTINKRINEALPDQHISFPEQPIFLIMKFLDSDTIDLLNSDLENLLNEAKI